MAVDVSDVSYVHGTFIEVPMSTQTSEAGFRGVVTIDADGYDVLRKAGLLNERAQATLIVADNDLTDEEGWTGEVGVRVTEVEGEAPKAELMLSQDDVSSLIAHGITEGVYCDVTVAKAA